MSQFEEKHLVEFYSRTKQERYSSLKKFNTEILKFLSVPIAKMGREFFLEQISLEEEEVSEMIHLIELDMPPRIDEFGRATFFYILIGGQVINLYQPGTVNLQGALYGKGNTCLSS